MDEHDEPGSLIGVVLASLVERVTALEQGRRPNRRPIVLDTDEPPAAGRQLLFEQAAELYRQQLPLTKIAAMMGYNVKTVRTYLRKAGVLLPAQKKETA